MHTDYIHIILADDDEDDILFFTDAFDELKINTKVNTFKDGEELMNYLNTDEAVMPNVLFLDLNMPKKTGLECLTEIKDNDNAEIISNKLSILASEKIIENVDSILEDKLIFKEQDDLKATYASKIEKSEGEIQWNDNAESIIGKINGLYPSPGAFFIFKDERYKILKAELGNKSGEIGEVMSNDLEISCGNQKSIKIIEIQRQGKKPQNINEFVLGSQIIKGSRITNV